MKKNKVALIVVIVLAVLAAWFIYNNKKGTIKETLRDFAVADTATVDKIFLADKEGNEVKLERQPTGVWTVNGKYNARMDAINMLLLTMKRVDVKEPVGKVAQDNVIKRLAAKAVKCEIFQKGELTKAYYVGTETADQTGTYMILIDTKTMQTSAKPFVTYIPGFEGYLTTRYFTKEADWRDRTVYSYVPNKIKSVKLEVPFNPEHGYELIIKGNNDYVIKQLSNGKEYSNFDTIAVKQYLSYFQNIHFETMDVMMKQAEIDSTLASKPINILTITDESGKVNITKFFPRKPKKDQLDVDGKLMEYDPERMNALLNEGDFVVVQYYVFGKLMPPADYFLKK